MSDDILFEEKQSFENRKAHVVLLATALILLVVFIVQFFSRSEDRQEISIAMSVGAVICFGIGIVIRKMALITQIRTDGILVRFPPLQPSQHYSWDDIQEVYVRQYNPIAEYGGWGVRIGRQGKAYNATGTYGLQIIFKDGTRLLIGTQQPEQVANALERLGR